MNEEILFHEVQRSRQWWLWLLVVVVTAGAWYSFIGQIILGNAGGGQPAANLLIWIIWLLAGIVLPALFLVLRLDVTVRSDRIDIRYFPLFRRTYSRKEVLSAQARIYRPLADYGGWGVRWSPVNGWAYNPSGNAGVQLQLEGGKKLLIGSQRPNELQAAIEAMRAAGKGKGKQAGGRRKGKRK
ncbi:MAG: DUF6141 family protein [Actinobacteria bacterium]|nr:DUF6141 family protein [Actinomycetota bacterium]